MRFLTVILSITMLGTSIHAGEDIAFHSQAGQDDFVHTILYNLLGKQDTGYYLEIGAGEPIYINNTYVFEKDYDWQGISIDISDNLMPRWYAERNNVLISKDATQLDYSSILTEFPQVIDYLSLDVDGYYDIVLKNVLQSSHVFKIITIEHDAYRYGDIYRSKEREILTAFGYYLLCPNVSNVGAVFEDWWIHPDLFPSDLLQQLQSLNLQDKDFMEIVKNIKMLTSN